MWYDPRKGSAPLVLKDVQINDLSAGKELGRFAMQVPFNDPWPMAADSRQLLYVADNRFIRDLIPMAKNCSPWPGGHWRVDVSDGHSARHSGNMILQCCALLRIRDFRLFL
jgi:hypothetical protein